MRYTSPKTGNTLFLPPFNPFKGKGSENTFFRIRQRKTLGKPLQNNLVTYIDVPFKDTENSLVELSINYHTGDVSPIKDWSKGKNNRTFT